MHIIGYIDLPSRLAPTASQLYGNNLVHLLADMGGAATFHDRSRGRGRPQRARRAQRRDDVAAAARRRRRRRRRRRASRVRRRPPPKPAQKNPALAGAARRCSAPPRSSALGLVAPPAFLSHLTVFALACFVGWQVVWNVTPALHTPLMSVTNAISGIIVIGGMLQLNGPPTSPAVLLGAAAILLSTINIAGGFLVTQRMLRMFHR